MDETGWVSGNRRRAFPGPSGDDGLGFGFRVGSGSRPYLCEVKATGSEGGRFELGESEVRAAREHAGNDRRRLLVVTHALTPHKPAVQMLPNLWGKRGRGRYRDDRMRRSRPRGTNEASPAGFRLHVPFGDRESTVGPGGRRRQGTGCIALGTIVVVVAFCERHEDGNGVVSNAETAGRHFAGVVDSPENVRDPGGDWSGRRDLGGQFGGPQADAAVPPGNRGESPLPV
ncbi:hypothetical protein [Streptomyces broussonetiae]|uniref:hypothetical protein n=1 Tax=Streptomyces broussonetiae TaxID=2686304 RepID=UPI0035DEC392